MTRPTPNFAILLLPLAVCAPNLPPGGEDGTVAQTGTFGQVAPQSADVRLRDTVMHQDDHGGTLQQLVCAAGSQAGFALLWRDHREGMMGLYLGRYDHDGAMRASEGPVHHPYAGRRLQPGLCFDASGAGMATWTADVLNEPVLFAHAFDASGGWLAPDQALTEMPKEMRPATERTRGVEQPCSAPLEGGGFAVAWTMRGAVLLAETNADGTRKNATQRLNPREQQAERGVQLLGLGKQGTLAVWRADGHLWGLSLRNTKAQPRDLGRGALVHATAGAPGEAWMLVQDEGRFVARKLRADGKVEGSDLEVASAPEQALDLAVLGDSVAVLVQGGAAGAEPAPPPARGRGGRTQGVSSGASFQLRLLDALHAGAPRGIDFLGAAARISGTPLVASDGTRLLVAWTDEREGDPDVYAALVDPSATKPLLKEFRANTDRASADQTSYRVDGSGAHGMVTWLDKRDGRPRGYARRLGAGAFDGDEFVVPGQTPGAIPVVLDPALRADGSCALLWCDTNGALHFAAVDAAAKPLAEPRLLAPEAVKDCCVLALPADQGWWCAWSDSEPSVWALRVTAAGEPAGAPQRLSRESKAQMNDLSAVLLGRRVAIAWDANDGGWRMRGRFASLDGVPQGDEFELEPSPRQQDWDPVLAPANNGGFLCAWTSGAPDDGSRDVVARFYDSNARASGPILWISPTGNEQDFPDAVRLPDGTWAVAWEDDISGYDHTYLRRIHKDQRELGPIVRINELETKSIEDRVAPRIAVLGDGLACAFGDRRRSLGWDALVRILGPKFDLVGKQ